MMKFADRFALTSEEQRVVVIDNCESALLRANKGFNKKRFKRQMMNLCCPKARVTILKMDEGLFSFGFDSQMERAIVLKRGSWIYECGLLVMAEADNLARPESIPLVSQSFGCKSRGCLFRVCPAIWVSLSKIRLEFMF